MFARVTIIKNFAQCCGAMQLIRMITDKKIYIAAELNYITLHTFQKLNVDVHRV